MTKLFNRTVNPWHFVFMLIALVSCKNKTESCDETYMNPSASIEERVNDLVSRMTLEEKASQLVYEAPAIERLGIPAYNWWNECLHGVARAGLATVFPQAVGMAASFDTELMFKTADVISDEARAKYHEAISRDKHGIYLGLTFWTPNINIFRDPRWGRGMETYGEDPFLTSKMGVSFIKGLQGNDPNYLKVVATAKHFMVHSGPESTRHSFDTKVNDYDFYNTYLPQFKATVQEAKVQSVMCAYNRYDGEPCCGSGFLLNDLLRDRLGFEGYVVSDCWALVDFFQGHMVSEGPVEASALALTSGTDLNCGSVFPSLPEAMAKGLVTEEDIDVAVKRLFTARFKLGMFDPDEMVPYAKIPYEVVNSKEHQQVALQMARESMVLLKNENHLLPLKKDLKTIAVIGPNAIDEEVLLGNYNGLPLNAVTPLAGIQQKVGKNTTIKYARGCDVAPNLPFLVPIPGNVLFTDESKTQQGLKAEFFDTVSFDVDPVFSRIDPNVDFNWWNKAPIEQLPDDNFSVRWTGVLVPEKTGDYYLGSDGSQIFKLTIDSTFHVEHDNLHEYRKSYEKIHLLAGKSYSIHLEYTNTERAAVIHLLWAPPVENLEQEAIAIAKDADAVIMFMGLSPRLEGEDMKVEVEGFAGGDRISLGLPKTQIQLMKKLKALKKPLILVLLNGSAVSIPWEKENIPAILEAWYPGQTAGLAIADILFGDYNPSGRLPVTFYKSAEDLPAFDNYEMKGRTYRYFEKEALFEFGYGLSYSTFNYSEIETSSEIIANDEPTILSVDIKNDSQYEGDEVVQLYVKYPESEIIRPLKDLKGFKRTKIMPGETSTVTFIIDKGLLSYNTPEGSTTESGKYTFFIGGSSNLKNAKSIALQIN
ncbi:MAG: glycoside hydrolase family 3 C-terminal domain-containing protein [Prolixibacteraceae bacterium]